MQTSKLLSSVVTLTLAVTLIAGCSKEAKKTRLLADADNYFKAGDYDKAKVSYLNVVQLDPQNALAFQRIGETFKIAYGWLVRMQPRDDSTTHEKKRSKSSNNRRKIPTLLSH
jgi:hypothetical protein